MDNVTTAILQAQADLADTREALREARELVQTLEADAKRIEVELVGMQSFADRYGLAPIEDSADIMALPGSELDAQVVPISEAVAQQSAVTDLLVMSRNEAVATVLGRADVPLDRSLIHEQCILGGRDDTLDEISLSLSGLKRSGRVQKLGRGLWSLIDSATG